MKSFYYDYKKFVIRECKGVCSHFLMIHVDADSLKDAKIELKKITHKYASRSVFQQDLKSLGVSRYRLYKKLDSCIVFKNTVKNSFDNNYPTFSVFGSLDERSAGKLYSCFFYDTKNFSSIRDYYAYSVLDRDDALAYLEKVKNLSYRELHYLNVSSLEKASIDLYTDTFYTKYNRYLYQVGVDDERAGVLEDYELRVIERLDNMFDRICLSSPRIVYRTLNARNAVEMGLYEDNVEIGSTLTFKGYLSTSLNAHYGLNYDNHKDSVKFEIYTPHGVNISFLSNHAKESEVLLPRNSKFMIVNKRMVEKFNKEFLLISLVAVNENNEVLSEYNKND